MKYSRLKIIIMIYAVTTVLIISLYLTDQYSSLPFKSSVMPICKIGLETVKWTTNDHTILWPLVNTHVSSTVSMVSVQTLAFTFKPRQICRMFL